MKNIFLSIVVVCALVIAGVGGTLATWSDSEISYDNIIVTGAVDLKVDGNDDMPWGAGVPVQISETCVIPEKIYGPYEVVLWNAGNCTIASEAYIHFRNLECGNADPKAGYADNSTGNDWSGDLKPEPELVAEYGGYVSDVLVDGIGHAAGDDCCMTSHIFMQIQSDPTVGTGVLYGWDEIKDFECKELPLMDLIPCNEQSIYFFFYLQQDQEEDYKNAAGQDFNYIKSPMELGLTPGTPEYLAAEMHWKKFNDWTSWAFMADTLTFDIEFDLFLNPEDYLPVD
jgi:predicted ribosomally synthesized peptide with SipW-like signal peptide